MFFSLRPEKEVYGRRIEGVDTAKSLGRIKSPCPRSEWEIIK